MIPLMADMSLYSGMRNGPVCPPTRRFMAKTLTSEASSALLRWEDAKLMRGLA